MFQNLGTLRPSVGAPLRDSKVGDELSEYVPSDAELEGAIRYLDAQRRQWRVIPLAALAALAVCWLPLGPVVFVEAWWTFTVGPILVVIFAMWVFSARGRANGERDVAFAWIKAARRADAPPLDQYLTLIQRHRHATARSTKEN